MRALLFALVATVSITASAKLISVRVCDQNERGEQFCRIVTYKDRGASSAQAAGPVICQGERGEEVACPTEHGVPDWLRGLNKWFTDRGYEAPTTGGNYDPSGA